MTWVPVAIHRDDSSWPYNMITNHDRRRHSHATAQSLLLSHFFSLSSLLSPVCLSGITPLSIDEMNRTHYHSSRLWARVVSHYMLHFFCFSSSLFFLLFLSSTFLTLWHSGFTSVFDFWLFVFWRRWRRYSGHYHPPSFCSSCSSSQTVCFFVFSWYPCFFCFFYPFLFSRYHCIPHFRSPVSYGFKFWHYQDHEVEWP